MPCARARNRRKRAGSFGTWRGASGVFGFGARGQSLRTRLTAAMRSQIDSSVASNGRPSHGIATV